MLPLLLDATLATVFKFTNTKGWVCCLLARIYQKQFLYAIAFKISQETGFPLSPAIEVVSRGLRSKKMETKRLMGNYMCGEIERSFHIKFSMKAAYTSFTDTESIVKFYSGR